MKQRLRLMAVMSLLTAALASCGDDALVGRSTPTVPLAPATPTLIPLPPDASTAARIRARGQLVVGVRYDDAPFGVVDERGDIVGFDVDLAGEVASRWLGDPEAVRFVQVTNSTASSRIASDQVDLIIGALHSHQSAASVMDFSTGYYYDGLALAVLATTQITDTIVINGPRDLAGKVIGVVESDDTEAPLSRAAGAAVSQIVYYPEYFSAFAGLDAGVVDAVVGPQRTLKRMAAGRSDVSITPRFNRITYAIGVPKYEGPFLDLVNVTLMSIVNDGTYQHLHERWFPGEPVPALERWAGTSRYGFEGLGDTLAPETATIANINARGHLLVGLVDNQLPFGDFDANAVAQGFEAELARMLAARWLGDVTAVQFVRHTEESGVAALQAGQIDILAARLPHTLRRDDEIDFSQTVYEGGIGLMVSAASGIGNVLGLNGRTVVVRNDAAMADVVQQAAAQAGILVSVQGVDDANAALAGVAEGRYAAYADWRSDLLNVAYANSGFLVLDDRLTTRPIALGLRQHDSDFRDLVNLTLQALAAEGRFAALYDDWFGTDPPYRLDIWLGTPYRPLKLNPSTGAIPTPAP